MEDIRLWRLSSRLYVGCIHLVIAGQVMDRFNNERLEMRFYLVLNPLKFFRSFGN